VNSAFGALTLLVGRQEGHPFSVFYFLVFQVFLLLVVGSVREIKLSHVGFPAHVKIVSRIVSYPACKNLSGGVLVWLSVCSEVHMAQLMPLPLAVSCFSKIQIGFTVLIPAHPGSPGKGPINVCVCAA